MTRRFVRWCALSWLGYLSLAWGVPPLSAADPVGGRVVEFALSPDYRWLAVTDRERRLDIRDAATGDLVARHQLADGGFHGVAWLPDSRGLFATQPSGRLLQRFGWRNLALEPDRSIPQVAEPTHLAVTASATWVARPWDHSLAWVPHDRDPADGHAVILLPLIPGQLIPLPNHRLLVLDAFQSQYALLDAQSGRLQAAGELTGHNLHGAVVQGDRVWIAHSVLDETAPLTAENILAGRVVSHRLTAWSLDSLATGRPEPSAIIPLDAPPLGAGDPAAVTALSDGTLAVALAGVHQVALVDPAARRVIRRIAVGERPVRLAPVGSDRLAVLLAGEQAVVVLALPEGTVVWRTAVGTEATPTPQRRGEAAFFDARLSAGGFLSCHTCHANGHTHGLRADTLNDGSHGTPKRTPTLRGTAMTYRWAWNGQFQNLHDQVRVSFRETQHAPQLDETTVLDVVSFLHTLPFVPPRRPLVANSQDADQVQRGRTLFERLQCGQCHIPPVIYAAHEQFDVGLVDERGLTKFNPPSLRGTAHQRRFFHDNRADSLKNVFEEFAHPGTTRLSAEDLAALLRFLESL